MWPGVWRPWVLEYTGSGVFGNQANIFIFKILIFKKLTHSHHPKRKTRKTLTVPFTCPVPTHFLQVTTMVEILCLFQGLDAYASSHEEMVFPSFLFIFIFLNRLCFRVVLGSQKN